VSITAIVVVFRTGPVLWACLDALEAAVDIAEIVVVDNGSVLEDEARLAALAGGNDKITLLRGHGNIGFAAGCNLGVRASAGEIVLFVNPDLVIDAQAPAIMADALARAFAPSVVGGDVRTPDGAPERGSRRLRLTLWRAIVSFSGLSCFEGLSPIFADINRERDACPSYPSAVGAVSGALMMMRRADFEAIGGFDEGYFLHVDDFDLCRRVEDAGGQVLFAPGAVGVHVGSTSDAPAGVVEAHKARSFAHYFLKYARSAAERLIARLAGAVLVVLLPLRARR